MKFLSEVEIANLEEAVKAAELKTSGEIVTVIVKKSSDTYWIPFSLTLILFCSLLLLDEAHFLNHLYLLFAFLGISGISFLLSKIPFVQRFFIPLTVQRSDAQRRAFFEFSANNVSQTEDKTGILIFISLMERSTVVLADQGISSKLPKETWDEIIKIMISAIKAGKTAEGLQLAVNRCGELLAEHFPAKEKNPNELPDRVIIKD